MAVRPRKQAWKRGCGDLWQVEVAACKEGPRHKDLPDLAVRDGKWKFLCEYDGSEPELYDMASDVGEKNNVAANHPKLVVRLTKACIAWHKSMPPDNGPQLVGNARRNVPKKPKKN